MNPLARSLACQIKAWTTCWGSRFAIEALFEVIQKVQARIQSHGDALQSNEVLTR